MGVGVAEGEPPPVGDALPDLLLVIDRVPEAVREGVPEGEPPPEGVREGVTVLEAERDFVGDTEEDTVAEGEGVGLENFHIL